MSTQEMAERALIGACLVREDALLLAREVPVQAMTAPSRQRIWRAIRQLVREHALVDVVTVSACTVADMAEIVDCSAAVFVGSWEGAKSYAEIVMDAYGRRRLADVGKWLQTAATDEERSLEDLVAMASESIIVAMPAPDEAPVEIGDVIAGVWDRMSGPPRETGLSYGFGGIDDCTLGLHRGEMAVLAARPSVGKSALAMEIGRHVAQSGHKALFVSLEMRAGALGERMLAAHSAVPHHTIRGGAEPTKAQAAQIASTAEKLRTLPLSILDTSSARLGDLEQACRLFAAKGGELVVVDYLQLVRVDGKGRSRVEQVTEISQGLKSIARRCNVAMLALSQLSREAEKREDQRPQLSDLRDSGSIEQDADVVLFLFRRRDKQTRQMSNETAVEIAKNRNGRCGWATLIFDPITTAFRETTALERARSMSAAG